MENFLSFLNTYSNFVLVLVTAAYTFFTYGLLRWTRKTLSANLAPVFQINISFDKLSRAIELSLKNHSSFPAIDVETFILGTYEEGHVSIESIVDPKYLRELKKDGFKHWSDGEFNFFSAYDKIIYQTFPGGHETTITLDLIPVPETLYIIFQYRDLKGDNFLQYSWFCYENKKEYAEDHTNFSRLKRVKRMDLIELAYKNIWVGIFPKISLKYWKLLLLRYINYWYCRLHIDKWLFKSIQSSFSSYYLKKSTHPGIYGNNRSFFKKI